MIFWNSKKDMRYSILLSSPGSIYLYIFCFVLPYLPFDIRGESILSVPYLSFFFFFFFSSNPIKQYIFAEPICIFLWVHLSGMLVRKVIKFIPYFLKIIHFLKKQKKLVFFLLSTFLKKKNIGSLIRWGHLSLGLNKDRCSFIF